MASRRSSAVTVHPIFSDVDVEAAQIDCTELIDSVINLMEFVGVVRLPAGSNELLKAGQDPPIHERQICRPICLWPKVVQVSKQDSKRVADPSVGIRQLVEHLFTERNLVAIVNAGNPQSKNVGAVFVDVVIRFRWLRITALLRLRNFLTVIQIDDEPVSQYFLVGRPSV